VFLSRLKIGEQDCPFSSVWFLPGVPPLRFVSCESPPPTTAKRNQRVSVTLFVAFDFSRPNLSPTVRLETAGAPILFGGLYRVVEALGKRKMPAF